LTAVTDRTPLPPVVATTAWYVGLAALTGFVALLPVNPGRTALPWPDLVLALALVWVVRRPDLLPLWPIAAVTLAADLLLHRPPGLWTALVILGTEFLRGRSVLIRDLPFFMEWAIVAAVVAAMSLGYRAALAVTLTDAPPLAPALAHMALTVLAYPPVAALSRLAFGVAKVSPGEVDDLGRRL
jgi:rod shape-determining protein MreD